MLRLHLQNERDPRGRRPQDPDYDPAHSVDGADGPVLCGVETLLSILNADFDVHFVDAAALDAARRATGWPDGHDGASLRIAFEKDGWLVRIDPADGDAPSSSRPRYFADWAITCDPASRPRFGATTLLGADALDGASTDADDIGDLLLSVDDLPAVSDLEAPALAEEPVVSVRIEVEGGVVQHVSATDPRRVAVQLVNHDAIDEGEAPPTRFAFPVGKLADGGDDDDDASQD